MMERWAIDFSNEVFGESKVVDITEVVVRHIMLNKLSIFLTRGGFLADTFASSFCFSLSRTTAEGFLCLVERRKVRLSKSVIFRVVSSGLVGEVVARRSGTCGLRGGTDGGDSSSGSSEKDTSIDGGFFVFEGGAVLEND